MKHLLLLLSLVFGLAVLPAGVFAKDKKDDDWKKVRKDLHDDVTALQSHYDQVKGRLQNLGGERRQFEELRGVRAVLDDANSQLDHTRYIDSRDAQDIHARIQRAHEDLQRVQGELDSNNQRRGEGGGGFYRRD